MILPWPWHQRGCKDSGFSAMIHTFILILIAIIASTTSDRYQYRNYFISDVCRISGELQTVRVPDGYVGITLQFIPINLMLHHVYNTSCKFEVEAPIGFHIFVILAEMSLRREQDGVCIDYLQFGGKDNLETEMLCGNISHSGNLLVKPGRLQPEMGDHMAQHIFQDTSQGVIQVHLKVGPRPETLSEYLEVTKKMNLKLVFTAFEGCADEFDNWNSCTAYDTICINEHLKCNVECGRGYYSVGKECKPFPTSRPTRHPRVHSYERQFSVIVLYCVLYAFSCFACARVCTRVFLNSNRQLLMTPRDILVNRRPQQIIHRPQSDGSNPIRVTRFDDVTVVVLPEPPLPMSGGNTALDEEGSCPRQESPPSYAQGPGNNPPPSYESLFPDVVARSNSSK